jgi:murein DD-endopeptidase MepM/ murein hydrolase activator NlpD
MLAGALLAAAAARAVTSSAETGATAHAYAIKIFPAGQGVAGTPDATAPPDASIPAAPFAYPADGSIVSIDSTSAAVSTTTSTAATASATTELGGIQLFGGEITVQHLVAAADAFASPAQASGAISPTAVTGVAFQGQPVAIATNGRVQLGDWGYMQTLVQTVGGGDPGTKAFHQSLRALDIHVNVDHGGLPAGSEIIIGWAEAFAQASLDTETVTIPKTGPKPVKQHPVKQTTGKGPGKKSKPTTTVRPIPPDLHPKLSRKGYVFPVYGQAFFSDSFGAPRADTGWHHGIDIFAPIGTPVLAVGEGMVYSVGWNNLGGNRLWLKDMAGNEYYYAHLSAYSPLAVNGTHVKAGEVLGFVGNTGDAITTPPHLHFEVHPASLVPLGYDKSAVDGYDWLRGLQHLRDVKFPLGTSAWQTQIAAHASSQAPGAVLLHATDISALPRLNSASVKRLIGSASSETAPLIERS